MRLHHNHSKHDSIPSIIHMPAAVKAAVQTSRTYPSYKHRRSLKLAAASKQAVTILKQISVG